MSACFPTSPAPRKPFPAMMAGVWLLATVGLTAAMLLYSNEAGRAQAAPARWPAASGISPATGMPTLIVFAHPHCPCSRATIGELAILMARSQGKSEAQVWFTRPAGVADDWMKTDLWRTAGAIPGVTVHEDPDSAEARRFHAETSGETLLYDRGGDLVFQGGITLSRGHSGDNPGRDAVEDFLEKPFAGVRRSRVFGCGLTNIACQREGAACTR